MRRRGRPPKLTDRKVAQARGWAGQGWTQQAIGDRLGVARSVVSELLARLGPAPVQEVLPEPADIEPDDESTTAEAAVAEVNGPVVAESAGTAGMAPLGSARVAAGGYRSRYAGAMLLYGYLDRVGAEAIFDMLTLVCRAVNSF